MRAPLPVAALLLIVACSSNESFTRSTDSQTEPGRAYVEAAVSSAYRQYGPGIEDGTRCFMAGLVDIFGLDALKKRERPRSSSSPTPMVGCGLARQTARH